MNILTFDIEEWYLEAFLHGGRKFKLDQYDDCFARLMDELDRLGIKATFFCVGKLAKGFPQVVKCISDRGHEVGCHSNEHTWLTKMDEATLRMDTSDALKALEDVSGKKVSAYRAPAFSITPNNKWAVGVLAECGIECDSSIFPAARDFGGYPEFPQDTPCLIRYGGSVLKEYPICITTIMGKTMAYSGGGYFRLLPYRLIEKTIKKRDYNICYFHLNDLISQKIKLKSRAEYEEYFNEPGTLKNRLMRYIKSNIGTGDGYAKLVRLMEGRSLMSLRQAEDLIDWNKTKTIDL